MTSGASRHRFRRNEFRQDARATRPCVFPVRCVYIDHANVPDAVGRRPSASLKDTRCSRNRALNGVLHWSSPTRRARPAGRLQIGTDRGSSHHPHSGRCGCNALRRSLTGALHRAALAVDRTLRRAHPPRSCVPRCSADRRAARPQALPPGLVSLRKRCGLMSGGEPDDLRASRRLVF